MVKNGDFWSSLLEMEENIYFLFHYVKEFYIAGTVRPVIEQYFKPKNQDAMLKNWGFLVVSA